MRQHIKDQKDNDFKLEYYKFILQEIRTLNENLHKYLALFQTLATLIIGGGIGIFVSWKSLKLDSATARVAIQGSLILLVLLTLFIALAIIANGLSWFDYRKEEVRLLDEVISPNFRKPPSLHNFWRWSETYVLFFIISIVIAVCIYVENQIIPLVK